MYKYEEPVVKILVYQSTDVCAASQEADDPWNDADWND